MKKLTAILLSLCMLCATLPALAEYSENELMEVTVATWLMDESFLEKNDPVYEMVQKKFGIKIKPISMTWVGYAESVGTWMATGDMPDVFTFDGFSGSSNMLESVYTWIDDDLLRPLPEDFRTKYPNLAARFDDPIVQLTETDGRYWAIPRYRGDSSGNTWATNRATYYRKDWAEKLGFEKLETWEDFVAFARAVKEDKSLGTLYPICGSADNIQWYLFPTFEEELFGWWQVNENGMYRAFDSEHTYDAATAIRELYNEGLIDPDILVKQNTTQYYDDFASGKAAILCGSQMFSLDSNLWDKMVGLNPDNTLEEMIGVIPMLPNVYDGTRYCYNFWNTYWAETFITTNVDDEKYERIMAFLDYTSSEEWINLYFNGIEGVDFEMVDGQVKYLTEDGKRPDIMTKYAFLNGINELTLLYEGPKFAVLTTKYDYVAEMFTDIHNLCMEYTPIPITTANLLITTEADEGFVDTSSELVRNYMFGGDTSDSVAAWAALQQQLIDDGVIANMEAKVEAARELGRIE